MPDIASPRTRGGPTGGPLPTRAAVRQSAFVRLPRYRGRQPPQAVRRMLEHIGAYDLGPDDCWHWWRVPLKGQRTVGWLTSQLLRAELEVGTAACGPFYGNGVVAVFGSGQGEDTVAAKRRAFLRARIKATKGHRDFCSLLSSVLGASAFSGNSAVQVADVLRDLEETSVRLTGLPLAKAPDVCEVMEEWLTKSWETSGRDYWGQCLARLGALRMGTDYSAVEADGNAAKWLEQHFDDSGPRSDGEVYARPQKAPHWHGEDATPAPTPIVSAPEHSRDAPAFSGGATLRGARPSPIQRPMAWVKAGTNPVLVTMAMRLEVR